MRRKYPLRFGGLSVVGSGFGAHSPVSRAVRARICGNYTPLYSQNHSIGARPEVATTDSLICSVCHCWFQFLRSRTAHMISTSGVSCLWVRTLREFLAYTFWPEILRAALEAFSLSKEQLAFLNNDPDEAKPRQSRQLPNPTFNSQHRGNPI